MGFFCVPYFPFWWHDTWIDEVGHMSGRIVRVDIEIESLQQLKGASRGVRDIAFWGQLFDALRPQRINSAIEIIRTGVDPAYRKAQLLGLIPTLTQHFNERNSRCSDPVEAAELEKSWSFDAPADGRCLRIKAKGEALRRQMDSQTAPEQMAASA